MDMPKGTMFAWAPLPGGHMDSTEFAMELADRSGVLVTPGVSFGPHGEGHVRMALVQPLARIAEAVRRVKDSGMIRGYPCGDKFDLHLHTTASDGMLEPEEIVRKAAKAGLVCIAITDHDTCLGVGSRRQRAAKLGLPVMAGAEFTAEYPGELHILGYGMRLRFARVAGILRGAAQAARGAQHADAGQDGGTRPGNPRGIPPWNVPGEYGRMHMALGLDGTGGARERAGCVRKVSGTRRAGLCEKAQVRIGGDHSGHEGGRRRAGAGAPRAGWGSAGQGAKNGALWN